FYHVVLDLQGFHAVGANTQADAAVRNAFQLLGNQPVACFRSILRQIPQQCPVDCAQGQAAIDDISVVILPMNVVMGRQQVGGELADYLFENIFQSNQSDDIPVLIDHESD